MPDDHDPQEPFVAVNGRGDRCSLRLLVGMELGYEDDPRPRDPSNASRLAAAYAVRVDYRRWLAAARRTPDQIDAHRARRALRASHHGLIALLGYLPGKRLGLDAGADCPSDDDASALPVLDQTDYAKLSTGPPGRVVTSKPAAAHAPPRALPSSSNLGALAA